MSEADSPGRFLRYATAQLPDLGLREETEDDLAFLQSLYASTREEELAQVDWPAAQKRAFLDHQFALQRSQYRAHYAGAEWLLITGAGAPFGRLYVKRGQEEVRLMDIALLPAIRNRGIGTRLTRLLLDWSDALALPVTLHVEPFNRAYRLYQRFGFAYTRSTGIYHFLRREPGTAECADLSTPLPPPQLKTIS